MLTKQTFKKRIYPIFQTYLGVFGTIIEYYDYAIYGFLIPIIAQYFFYQNDDAQAIMNVYSIFAVGSVAKVFGSIIFGIIGDRYGRSVALKWNIFGMCIATYTITLIPSYRDIGVYSVILLLICRGFQGIFIAAESDGARLLLYESFSKRMPCFLNNIVNISCYIGILIASQTVIFATKSLPNGSELIWKIPLRLGAICGFLLFLLRNNIIESNDYLKNKQNLQKNCSKAKDILYYKAFYNQIIKLLQFCFDKKLLASIGICGFSGGSYHIVFTFFLNFFNKVLHIHSNLLAEIQSKLHYCLILYLVVIFVASILSDYIKNLYYICFFGFFSLFISTLLLIMKLNFIINCKLSILLYLIAISMAFSNAPLFAIIMEKFDIMKRYRSISISHSLGSAIFSGTAPLMANFLWVYFASLHAPLIYFLILQIIGLSGVIYMYKVDLFKK